MFKITSRSAVRISLVLLSFLALKLNSVGGGTKR